jgi:hypothetical protein
MANKFIIVKVEECGVLVKFVPSITTKDEIYNYMINELSGVNRWKAFGDNIWFFKQYGYDKYGIPTDENSDDENADSDDE